MSNKLTPKSVIRIIKKPTCPKLFPTVKAELPYHIGYDETAKTLHARGA